MTYEENIHAIAKEMADCKFTTDQARIAVRLQMEAFRDGAEWGAEGKGIEAELFERGLISDKEPGSCPICSIEYTTDETGTYCDNHNCKDFWQTK